MRDSFCAVCSCIRSACSQPAIDIEAGTRTWTRPLSGHFPRRSPSLAIKHGPWGTAEGASPPGSPVLRDVGNSTSPIIANAALHDLEKNSGIRNGQDIVRPTLGTLDRIINTKRSRRAAADKSRKIRDRVVNCAHSSLLDYHVKFLSDSEVCKVVDAEAVVHELTRSKKGPIVATTPTEYRKILAILYFLDLPTKVRLFVEQTVCDRDLPFKVIDDPQRSDNGVALKSIGNPSARLVPFKRRKDADKFAKQQWSVMAFHFRSVDGESTPHYELEDEEIMPFLWQSRTKTTGASGAVFKTGIFPDHHCWDWNITDVSWECCRSWITH